MRTKLKLLFIIFNLASLASLAQEYGGAIHTSEPNDDEGEAHIVINPLDSNKLVVGFMDEGSPISFRIFYSLDAGNTWNASQFSPYSAAQSRLPNYVSAGGGDIVLAYDKDGNLYCSWLYLLANTSDPDYLQNLLWRSFWAKSSDNGLTFTLEEGDNCFFGKGKVDFSNNNFSVAQEDDGICDRQWMAADLSDGQYSNNVYLAYLRVFPVQDSIGLVVQTLNPEGTAFHNPVMAYQGAAQHTNILVDGNGKLHYTFINTQENNLYYMSSDDGAQSFTTPTLLYEGVSLISDDENNVVINGREGAAPSLAVDGQNNLHLVWADFVNSQLKSFYSKSTDNGQNWSTPVSLTEYFENSAFMPVVSAFESRVTIGANIVDQDLKSLYKIISSKDYGQSFGNPTMMSSEIMDLQQSGKNVFLGDYSSAVRTHCNIYSLWTHCEEQDCRQYIAKYDECNPSNIVEHTPFKHSFSVQNLFPNPVKGILYVNVKADKNEDILCEIFSVTGQLVWSENHSVKEGDNVLKIEARDLATGTYLLKVSNDSKHFVSRKFNKQ